jgi:hypothetical protein
LDDDDDDDDDKVVCNIFRVASNKEILTWEKFATMTTEAEHANPWNKFHFAVGL